MNCVGLILFKLIFMGDINLSELPDEIVIWISTGAENVQGTATRYQDEYLISIKDVVFKLIGKPEFYPLDKYFIYMDILFSNIVLNFSTLDYDIVVETKSTYWPIRFDRVYIHKTSLSLQLLLERPTWEALPFLIFFSVLFSGLSCTIFIRKKEKETLYKRLVYLLVIAILVLIFSLNFLQETPQPKTFLPLKSIMLISALISISLFMITSVVASAKNSSYLIADSVSIFGSILAVSFLIQLLIFNCKAWLWDDLIYNLIFIIRIIVASLLMGIVIYVCIYIYHRKIHKLSFLPRLRYRIWTKHMEHLLYVSLVANLLSTLITVSWVNIIGPKIELNPFWRFMFTITRGSIFMYILPFILMFLLFAGIHKYIKAYQEDFPVLVLFCIVILDFFNNTLLISPCDYIPMPFTIGCLIVIPLLLALLIRKMVYSKMLVFH